MIDPPARAELRPDHRAPAGVDLDVGGGRVSGGTDPRDPAALHHDGGVVHEPDAMRFFRVEALSGQRVAPQCTKSDRLAKLRMEANRAQAEYLDVALAPPHR